MNTKLLYSLFLLLTAATLAHAQGTAFTYQGRLNLDGAPVNGDPRIIQLQQANIASHSDRPQRRARALRTSCRTRLGPTLAAPRSSISAKISWRPINAVTATTSPGRDAASVAFKAEKGSG